MRWPGGAPTHSAGRTRPLASLADSQFRRAVHPCPELTPNPGIELTSTPNSLASLRIDEFASVENGPALDSRPVSPRSHAQEKTRGAAIRANESASRRSFGATNSVGSRRLQSTQGSAGSPAASTEVDGYQRKRTAVIAAAARRIADCRRDPSRHRRRTRHARLAARLRRAIPALRRHPRGHGRADGRPRA